MKHTRKGHWRTLADGTRTWVTPHDVGKSDVVSHGYDDEALARRIRKKAEKGQMNAAAEAAKIFTPDELKKLRRQARKLNRSQAKKAKKAWQARLRNAVQRSKIKNVNTKKRGK